MEVLAVARGLDSIGGRLNAMFGEQVGSRVMREYVEKMTRARESGTLGFTAAGLTTSERSVKSIPKNTFYGS